MDSDLVRLERELKRTKDVLWYLIAWMAQSANSPISIREAEQLRDDLFRDAETAGVPDARR